MSKKAFILTMIGFGSACSPQVLGPVGPMSEFPVMPEFAREPARRATILSGRAGTPIMAFDPGIYVDDEGYHLFYTTVFCRLEYGYSFSWDPANPDACNIVDDIGSLAYAFSADRGLTWTFRTSPVVEPSHSGFDSAKIETAHPFRKGDVLYLAYSADGDAAGKKLISRYQIGIAKLELGKRSVREAMLDETTRFERRSSPLLGYDLRGGRFDSNVQEPSIVFGPDGILLYYVGLGLTLPNEGLDFPGQEITSVGLGRAVLNDDLRVISRSDSPILKGANIAEVVFLDGAYHMIGTGPAPGEFHEGARLNHSASIDGINWSVPTPLIRDSIMGLDEWGAMAPTVAVEDDRLVLFYTAYSTGPGPCFPVPADGRFGRPVLGGDRCLYATIGRAVSIR